MCVSEWEWVSECPFVSVGSMRPPLKWFCEIDSVFQCNLATSQLKVAEASSINKHICSPHALPPPLSLLHLHISFALLLGSERKHFVVGLACVLFTFHCLSTSCYRLFFSFLPHTLQMVPFFFFYFILRCGGIKARVVAVARAQLKSKFDRNHEQLSRLSEWALNLK